MNPIILEKILDVLDDHEMKFNEIAAAVIKDNIHLDETEVRTTLLEAISSGKINLTESYRLHAS